MTATGWLSVVLSVTAAVSARWIGREETRTAGSVLGLVAQPGWILLSLITGAWGFLGATAYWIYTYLRVAGWWPRWLPETRWPGPLRRMFARRGRHRMPVSARSQAVGGRAG